LLVTILMYITLMSIFHKMSMGEFGDLELTYITSAENIIRAEAG